MRNQDSERLRGLFTSHSFNMGLGSRSLDPLVMIWNCVHRLTLTERREQEVTSPHPMVNGAQQIWGEGHSIPPHSDLPSCGDICLPVPPSRMQLRPETISWLSDAYWNQVVYLTVLRARCPYPFSLTRKQVWRVIPRNTGCLAHRGGPGKREGKECTQGNVAPNGLGTQLCLRAPPRGPLLGIVILLLPLQ